jgi:hypothetical protein
MEPPVIAAVIALVGSILTLAGTVFMYWRGKALERRSINKAILAEVARLLRVVVPDHIKWKDKADPKYPLIRFSTPVYDKQVQNIGGLDDEIVALVVMFYGYLAYINALQKLRLQYIQAEKAHEFNEQYAKSLERLLGDFASRFDHAFDKYNINELPKSASEPNATLELTQAGQSAPPGGTAAGTGACS